MSDFILKSNSYTFKCVVDASFEWDPQQLILNLEKEENLLLEQKNEQIPLCIFRKNVSPLQAIIKYLKENKKIRNKEISELLKRDQRTIWTEYASAKNKKTPSKKELEKETRYIDTQIFQQRIFSVLETIIIDLLNKGYKQKEIALLLNKSPKTISTLKIRAEKKRQSLKLGGLTK